MSTQQYAMVRGRVIRVTELGACGSLQYEPIRYAVANCVANVTVNEVTEAGSNEVVRNDEDDPALHFVNDPEILGHTADINFLKVDPGILSLVAGIEPVYDWNSLTEIIGFDQKMRVPVVAFGLEVWSKLAASACEPGQRKYGYTLFPFLKGGYISGFEFSNSLVSFKIVGAQSRMGAKWGSGPHVLKDNLRLPTPVSGNTSWRNFIYAGEPPAPTEGIVEFNDAIEGGNATITSSDVLDGEFVITSADTVEGGSAA